MWTWGQAPTIRTIDGISSDREVIRSCTGDFEAVGSFVTDETSNARSRDALVESLVQTV